MAARSVGDDNQGPRVHDPTPSVRNYPQLARLRAVAATRAFRVSFALGGLVGIYAALGFWLAPLLLKTQLSKAVHEELGCELSLRQVRVHPFKFWVELSGIALRDRKGEPLLEASRFALDFQALASIWQRCVVFEAVALEQPRLRVTIRREGGLNLADLSPLRPAAKSDVGKGDEAAEPPKFWFRSLRLDGGRIDVQDCARKACFERAFERLHIAVRDLRTTVRGGSFELASRLNDGTGVAWKGSVSVTPSLASSGSLQISNTPLASVAEYLGDALPVGALSGTASLNGSYIVSLAKGGPLEAKLHALSIDDLRVSSAASQAGRVDVARVELSDAQIGLLSREVTIEALRVRGLKTQALIDPEGDLNLAHLVRHERSHAASAQPASSAPWAMLVKTIELRDAAVDVEHQTGAASARMRIAPIDITVSDWSSDARKPFVVDTQLAIQGGGRFVAKGPVTLEPLASDLNLHAQGLDLDLLQPYVTQFANFALEDGTLGFDGTLALRATAPRAAFRGAVKLEQLHTLDNEQRQDLFNVRAMELRGVRLEAEPSLVDIERVDLREPYARVILRPDSTLNLASAFSARKPKGTPADKTRVVAAGPASAPARASAASSDASIPIRVGTLAIERMRMDFADTLVRPHFALDLRRVNGSIRGISSDKSSRAVVALKGTLGDNAPVSIDGALRPFAYDRYTDIRIRADNISLPIFNPYSGRFAGYNIARGELSTEVHYQVVKRQLEAAHSIRIDQLKWGEATDTKEAAPFPVRLATVLLRDQNGVINLDVPLHGSLDDPTFSVWPLVFQVIKNVCVKAVAAPFMMLASVFKGSEDAKYVDFEPGHHELSQRSKSALDALSKALGDREELTLVVPIKSLPASDRPALIERRLMAQVQEELEREAGRGKKPKDFLTLDSDDQIDVLSDTFEHRYGKEALIPDPPPRDPKLSRAEANAAEDQFRLEQLRRALRSKITVGDDELERLGRERAEAIERAVSSGGKLASHRVLLSGEGEVAADKNNVRVTLELK